MKKLLSFILFLVVSLQTSADGLDSLFGTEPQFLPEEQAFVFNFEQQGNQIIVRWNIAQGYYLYKKNFNATSETTSISNIERPQGKVHFDEYFGEQEVYYNEAQITFTIDNPAIEHEINFTYQGCADAGLCYPPGIKVLFFDPQVSEQDELAGLISSDTFLASLALFFVLGIGLAFTPCVFPMYPILSGIIVGSGNKLSTKQAFALSFAYVQGMALTYSALGLVVASLGLQFQAYFQHPAVLGSLAVLFTILALSMFGVFNLQMPASWQAKLNNASNQQSSGRFGSVFIMGMISGLVASPCTTAPLSGVLIYVAQTGDLLTGGLTLYVLSLGMGVPLLLLGVSGGKLLPKAGAWMEVIKGIFGFMLLSVVLVLLERFVEQMWMSLSWTVLAIFFIGYLMHHNNKTTTSAFKTVRTVITHMLLICATLYALIIGATFYSLLPWQTGQISATNQTAPTEFIQVKGIDELNQQLAIAKAAGKPVMVDFYADWCIACKDFEHKTFTDPLIMPILKDMVLIQSDVTANDELDIELQDKMQVLGLPTIMFFNAQGERQRNLRVVGFQGPKQFAKTLSQIK